MDRPWKSQPIERSPAATEARALQRLVGAFSDRTIRGSLLKIVLAALLPLVGLAIWQGFLVLNDSRELVASRLRANAWAIAEQQRDPFIISRHTLRFAGQADSVKDFTEQCNLVLQRSLVGASGIINFVRTDADGKARCSVLPFTPGQDLSNDTFWREAQGRKQIFVAQPQIGTISQRAVLIMVLPMFSDDGSFNGTLSSGVDIAQLRASLKTKKAGMTGVAMVSDRMGRTMVNTSGVSFRRLEDVVGAQTGPRRGISTDGRQWTYVAAPLYSDELYVIYAEPYRDVTSSALSRIWPNILLPALSILFVLLAIWVGTQDLIISWLRKLQALTARFARGDFRSELAEFAAAPAELNEAALDLHNMAAAIEAKDQQLQTAARQQMVLSKELNHRVKNNLQIVSSLLSLQSDKIVDPVARGALNQARSRIAALGLIHRLLYEEQTGEIRRAINMTKLFGELCAQLRANFRRQTEVELDCDIEGLDMSIDQAVPATLFVVEAISNAFHHAFLSGRSGAINLSLQLRNMEVWITIADDGSGFDAEALASDTGLALMQSFADQLSGKLEVATGSEGTAIELHFVLDKLDDR